MHRVRHDHEDKFHKSDEVVLDRNPNHHMTFGVGAHRCLGTSLAKAEMENVLDEVLGQMPDHHIAEEKVQKPYTIGIVYGRVWLPATFTPSPAE